MVSWLSLCFRVVHPTIVGQLWVETKYFLQRREIPTYLRLSHECNWGHNERHLSRCQVPSQSCQMGTTGNVKLTYYYSSHSFYWLFHSRLHLRGDAKKNLANKHPVHIILDWCFEPSNLKSSTPSQALLLLLRYSIGWFNCFISLSSTLICQCHSFIMWLSGHQIRFRDPHLLTGLMWTMNTSQWYCFISRLI